MAVFEEFKLVEVIVLGVIAVLVVVVAICWFRGLDAKGYHTMGDKMLSALRGTNGTIYAVERKDRIRE